MVLDHVIVTVNDLEESVRFYTAILGLTHEGQEGPFSVIRVTDQFTIQLAPWRTKGGEHLAFAMSTAESDAVFARIRSSGIEYGDSFHSVGNRKAPGKKSGARGLSDSMYFFDPSKHLIEIRHYGA